VKFDNKLRMCSDVYNIRGALNGLYTALYHATNPYLVIASLRGTPTHEAKASWGPEGRRGNPYSCSRPHTAMDCRGRFACPGACRFRGLTRCFAASPRDSPPDCRAILTENSPPDCFPGARTPQ
jgi:hypothetical protein